MLKKRRRFLVIVSFILLACFFILSFLVAKDYFVAFDFAATVRTQNHISDRFNIAFSFFSLLGSFETTVIFLIFLTLFINLSRKRFFLSIFVCFFFLHLLELAGKLLIYHPGPPFMFFRYELDFFFPSSYISTDFSYPSGHMARTAFSAIVVIFLLLSYLKARLLKILATTAVLGIVLIMFISRIYLGEHWFSDVFGGILLGSSMAGLALAFFKK